MNVVANPADSLTLSLRFTQPRTLLPTLLLIWLLLLGTISSSSASTSPRIASNRPNAPAQLALPGSLLSDMRPRCELDLTGSDFKSGDRVFASWRIYNPAPTRVSVEIKIWFTAPGQAPYSITSGLENGGLAVLPASLDEKTQLAELFEVDDTTTRGSYEINCRLIDPITGRTVSEDLNGFQVL